MKTIKRDRLIYFAFLILAAIFIVLKVQRGIEETDEQGGFWNIIQGIFVIFGSVSLFRSFTQIKTVPTIVYYLSFAIWIWFLSCFSLFNKSIDASVIFHFITVPYGCLVLIMFFSLSLTVEIKQYSWLLLSVFYIIVIMLYMAFRNYTGGAESDYGTVADIYYVIGLLPLAMLYMPRKWSFIPFFAATVVVMMTGKRGAFVALALVLACYYLIPRLREGGRRKSPIRTILLFVVVAAGAYFIIDKLTDVYNFRMFDRMSRIGEDEGSGRLIRWGYLIQEIAGERSFAKLLFGHGKSSVTMLFGGHAHNDFLEFAYDYGFFAVVLYILFFVSMIRESIKMYRCRYTLTNEFVCCVVIAFCLAFYSFYAVDCTHITCSSICLGLILADWYKFRASITQPNL